MRLDRAVEGWPLLFPSQPLGSPASCWQVSLAMAEPPRPGDPALRQGPLHWQWHESGSRSRSWLELSGGAVPSAGRLDVAWQERRIDVRHSLDGVADPLLEMLNRWVLPDIARWERGAVPLHGAALELAAGAVVICGPSGRGKSSLAAALLARGATLLADEPTCVVAQPEPLLLPGCSRLRLVAAAAAELADLGLLGGAGPLDWAGKRVISTEAGSARPRPLRALLLLDPRHSGGPPLLLQDLSPEQALPALMAERYCRPNHPERRRHDLLQLAALVSGLTVWRASLTDDLSQLAWVAEELELQLAGLAGATRPSP